MIWQKNPARHRGLATVEAALVLGLLLLVILGGLEFGLQFYVRHTMANAAREGARQLAVRNGTAAQAKAIAEAQLNGINADFTVSTSDDGTDVTVTVSVPRDQVSLNIDGFLGLNDPDETIVTYTTMRKESQ